MYSLYISRQTCRLFLAVLSSYPTQKSLLYGAHIVYNLIGKLLPIFIIFSIASYGQRCIKKRMESQSSSKKREKKLLLGDKLSSWSFTIPLPSYLVLSFAFCYAVFRDILQWAIIISSSFLVGTQQTLVTPAPVYKECKCPYIYEVLDIIIWIKTLNINKENILSLFPLIVWMLLRVVGYAIYLKGDEMWPCCYIHTPQNGKRKEGRKGFCFAMTSYLTSSSYFFFLFLSVYVS